MLKLLNAGDYAGAGQFELWDHASGKVVAGLLRRRRAEEAEFNAV
jgi:lysozyme